MTDCYDCNFLLQNKIVKIQTKDEKWRRGFGYGKQNHVKSDWAGAIAEIATEAKAQGFSKAFICSDPDLIKFNVTSKVTDILDKEGLAYEIYSDIKANPTIENV